MYNMYENIYILEAVTLSVSMLLALQYISGVRRIILMQKRLISCRYILCDHCSSLIPPWKNREKQIPKQEIQALIQGNILFV